MWFYGNVFCFRSLNKLINFESIWRAVQPFPGITNKCFFVSKWYWSFYSKSYFCIYITIFLSFSLYHYLSRAEKRRISLLVNWLNFIFISFWYCNNLTNFLFSVVKFKRLLLEMFSLMLLICKAEVIYTVAPLDIGWSFISFNTCDHVLVSLKTEKTYRWRRIEDLNLFE